MIFQNSPFEILDKAFKNLYPDKSYIAFIDVDMKDESGEKVYGCTQFNDCDTPIIFIDSSLSIQNAIEIFAHELAHVAVGAEEEHGKLWEKAFDEIQSEYNRIGEELWEQKRNSLKLFLFVRNAEKHRNQTRNNQRIIGTCLTPMKNVNAAESL